MRLTAGTPVGSDADGLRYAAWFHELDAWTEYGDVYHPETKGRYYFGDAHGEKGLLTQFLPRDTRPPAFSAWIHMATEGNTPAAAVLEVDALLARLFSKHFGDAKNHAVQIDCLQRPSDMHA